MERILQQLGLTNLLRRFEDERIDEKIVVSWTDSELSRLGVSTIGDRIRLRKLCKQAVQAGQGLRHLQHQLLKNFAIYFTVTEEEVKKEPNKQKKGLGLLIWLVWPIDWHIKFPPQPKNKFCLR